MHSWNGDWQHVRRLFGPLVNSYDQFVTNAGIGRSFRRISGCTICEIVLCVISLVLKTISCFMCGPTNKMTANDWLSFCSVLMGSSAKIVTKLPLTKNKKFFELLAIVPVIIELVQTALRSIGVMDARKTTAAAWLDLSSSWVMILAIAFKFVPTVPSPWREIMVELFSTMSNRTTTVIGAGYEAYIQFAASTYENTVPKARGLL